MRSGAAGRRVLAKSVVGLVLVLAMGCGHPVSPRDTAGAGRSGVTPRRAAAPGARAERHLAIGKERAYEIVTRNGRHWLGTWIVVSLKNGCWHISARSKSAHAPEYHVVDGNTGRILYTNDNTDVRKVPAAYSQARAVERYRLVRGRNKMIWIKDP